jgi:hypothetical protein
MVLPTSYQTFSQESAQEPSELDAHDVEAQQPERIREAEKLPTQLPNGTSHVLEVFPL